MPRKRSAKPTDDDFRWDSSKPPLLMEKTAEETRVIKPNHFSEGKVMPIIDFSDMGLDDLPELKILPAGTEAKLRILDVSIKPDRNGDEMLQIRLDVADEPNVKEVYWQCHFPKASMNDKRVFMLKQFLSGFCEAFEIDKTAANDTNDWVGKEGWAILGVRSDPKYGDSNEVTRWVRGQ